MIYLGNNHVGYHQSDLCFPAIAGCHAICYVTAKGLFGFHNMGGAEEKLTIKNNAGKVVRRLNIWKPRSETFASFVTSHPQGNAIGKMLYGVCFATGGNSRGYGNKAPLSVWLGELTSFAKALNYTGPIWGYDMANQTRPQPVNVRYGKVGSSCVIQLKSYHPVETLKGPNSAPNDHQLIRKDNATDPPTFKLQATESRVVTSISDTGWQTIYPEKLN